jgi:hypothetical protein
MKRKLSGPFFSFPGFGFFYNKRVIPKFPKLHNFELKLLFSVDIQALLLVI